MKFVPQRHMPHIGLLDAMEFVPQRHMPHIGFLDAVRLVPLTRMIHILCCGAFVGETPRRLSLDASFAWCKMLIYLHKSARRFR